MNADLVFDTPLICFICCLYVLFHLFRDKTGSKEVQYFRLIVISTIWFIFFDYGYTMMELYPKYLTYDVGFWMDWGYNVFCSASSLFWFLYACTVLRKHSRVLEVIIQLTYLADALMAVLMLVTKNRQWFVHIEAGYLYSDMPDGIWAIFQTIPIILILVVAVRNYFDKRFYAYRERILPIVVYPIVLFIGCAYKFYATDSFILMGGMTLSILYLFMVTRLTLVYTDELTKLSNRRMLYKELESMLVSPTPWFFVMLDADGFKEINDRFGHREGDRALRIIGKTFQSVSERYSARAYRYAGDEFVVIFPGEQTIPLEKMCREINASIHDKATQINLPYKLHLSYGYVCVTDGNYDAVPDILADADAAMYKMKQQDKEKVLL